MSGKNAGEDWEFLKSVHSLLEEGNVLNTTEDKPIVTFKFPEELKVNDNDVFCSEVSIDDTVRWLPSHTQPNPRLIVKLDSYSTIE